MAALSPPRLVAAWRVEAPFPRFPSSMGASIDGILGSLPDLARRNTLLQEGFST